MAKLMQCGPVVIHLIVERLLRRQLYAIRGRHVERLVTADTDLRARRGHEAFGTFDGLALAKKRPAADRQRVGESLALVDIEDGEPLEECHLPAMLVTGVGDGFVALVLRREAIGVTDGRAGLAFPHIAAQRLRLFVGQPPLRPEPALEHGRPEDQDVDPRIAPPGPGVARQPAFQLRTVPWLHPRHPPRLQLRDDPVGDLGVERAGGFRRGVLCHCPHSLKSPQPAPEWRGWAAGADRQSRWSGGLHPKGRNEEEDIGAADVATSPSSIKAPSVIPPWAARSRKAST